MLRDKLYNPWFREDDWGLEILDGNFKGTVIKINSMEFSKEQEGNVDLDYVVVYKPDTVFEDTSSESFYTLMSEIIGDVLTEAIKLQQDEQNRTNDTTQPGQ